MRIGIEAQRIFREKKHGMDMVALELIRNLQQIDTENEYFLFIKPDSDNMVVRESANFRIVELEGGSYPFWEQIALLRASRKYKCDILHCTSNTAPLFSSIPLVVTLHDIIYMETGYMKILTGGATAYQRFGNAYRRMIVPRIIKKSKKIITVSDFEKNRIAKFFAIRDDGRLTSVYNGVGSHFKPVTDKAELLQVKKKYKLPDRYFFFLGNTDPKKNTKGTLKAYADFLKQTGSDIRLVMIDFDRSELEKILDGIGAGELIDRIVLTGYVNNTDLPAIYCQSELFLYPSLRESFGLPMLEAMACGVPVITSDTSSMPEVAGDAAFIINPFKPEEITAAMVKITSDRSLRSVLTEKGLIQAAKFSWRSMAENVLKIYREVNELN